MPSRRRRPSLALAALLALPAPAPAELIEQVLADIGGRPVLLSDVRLVESLRGLSRQAALEAVIDERLMLQEASRLPQVALSEEEEERAIQALRAAHPEAAGLSEAGLRRLALRQALILRYVELRFRPLVRVTEEALREAYDAEFGGSAAPPAFEDARDALEARRVREALDERIEQWVRELREAAEVRYRAGGP
jgi:hypothetical protein